MPALGIVDPLPMAHMSLSAQAHCIGGTGRPRANLMTFNMNIAVFGMQQKETNSRSMVPLISIGELLKEFDSEL